MPKELELKSYTSKSGIVNDLTSVNSLLNESASNLKQNFTSEDGVRSNLTSDTSPVSFDNPTVGATAGVDLKDTGKEITDRLDSLYENRDGIVNTTRGAFGGNGGDGNLGVLTGTTNIDANNENIVIKNYTSITISAGATLGLTNKAANGTVLILKSTGDVKIEGTIDLDGDGADVETTGYNIADDVDHYGAGGGNGGTGTAGSGGTAGAIYQNLSLYLTSDANLLYKKYINLACGSGGGNGGNGKNGTSGGAGGEGGGAVIIECRGALNFTGTINVNGVDGSDANHVAGGAAAAGGGGGGGGAAGMALILYNSLDANTGTINAKGGAGGNGGNGGSGSLPNASGGGGGAGGGSWSNTGGAGGDGGANGGNDGDDGANATNSEGASGGGGGADSSGQGGTGGTQGSSDSNHYLVVENTIFA